jgi:hypothetical protein
MMGLALSMNCTVAQSDAVAQKIQAANAAVEQAYIAVSSAEAAEVNVADLVYQLNDASATLAMAENAYHSGDSVTALSRASAAQTLAQQVTESVHALSRPILGCTNVIFVSSLVAGVVFVGALFLLWRFLRARQLQRLLDLQPEVQT